MQEQGEQQRADDAIKKRGTALAGIALVAVLALAFVAYGALSSGAKTATSTGQSSNALASGVAAGTDAGADSGPDSAPASGAVSTSDAASASGAAPGSNDAESERGPNLSEYNATVYDEYGDARTLVHLADGKPLVMNFWATWCPYCVQEMDDYQQIYDEYEGRVSFAFIDIADGKRETVADGASWLLEHEYTLPAYYDTTLEAMYAYGATNLPTTVVVAADGEIMDVSPGAIDPDLMRSALDSLLGD